MGDNKKRRKKMMENPEEGEERVRCQCHKRLCFLDIIYLSAVRPRVEGWGEQQGFKEQLKEENSN